MTRVRMLVDISGGRADGTEWPRHGLTLDCGDDEAGRLVAGGHAEWDSGGAEPAQDAPPAAGAGDGQPGPENGSQDDDSPADPSKPRVRDPKETWEQHATTVHGVDPNMARSMTKSDLIAQYGNPA